MITKKFGLIIKDKRKELNLSQEKLAHKANLHRTYIGMVERGEKNITLQNIEKLANAFNCTISDLLSDL